MAAKIQISCLNVRNDERNEQIKKTNDSAFIYFLFFLENNIYFRISMVNVQLKRLVTDGN